MSENRKKLTDVQQEFAEKLIQQFSDLVMNHAGEITEQTEDACSKGKSKQFKIRFETTAKFVGNKLELNAPKSYWTKKTEINGNPATVDLDTTEDLPGID